MAKNPFLSIVLPVYSGSFYFKRCLESLLKQKTDEDYEIVLSINLDAEEECKKLAEEALAKDDHFLSIKMDSANLAKTICRLEGVKAAHGEYITFLDNDDFYLDETAVDKMVKEVKKKMADVTIFPYFIVKKDKTHLAPFQRFKAKSLSKKEAFNKLNKDTSMPYFLWNKVFKKDLFEKNLIIYGKKEDMFEDCVLTTSLYLNAESFYRSNIPYYCYVVDNPNSATNERRTDRAYYHLCSYASERFYIERYFPTYLEAWEKAKLRHVSFLLFDSFMDFKNGKSSFFHYLRELNDLHKFKKTTEGEDYEEVVKRSVQ